MRRSAVSCAAVMAVALVAGAAGAAQPDLGRISWIVGLNEAQPVDDPPRTRLLYGQLDQIELTMLLGNSDSSTAVYFHDGRIRHSVNVRVGLVVEGRDDVVPVPVRVEWPGVLENYETVQTLPDQQLRAETGGSVRWRILVSRADYLPFAPGLYRIEVDFLNVRAAITTSSGEPWGGGILGEREGHLKTWTQLLVRTPETPAEFVTMYRREAHMARMRERFQDALLAYSKALEADPSDAGTLFGLGTTYLDMGRYKDALAILRNLPLRDVPSVQLLALAYLGSGDEATAASVLRGVAGGSEARVTGMLDLARERLKSRPPR